MSKRAGFTLIEMLVVLLILAAIAGTALNAGLGFADDARLEQTRNTLNSLERACIGDPQAIDATGRPRSFGFVNDMGRLPKLVLVGAGTAEERWLLPELLEPMGLPPYSLFAPAGDKGLRIGCGWRGPYYRAPFDEFRIADGWGRDLVYLDRNGNPVLSADDDWFSMLSLGRDGAPGGIDYDRDWAIQFDGNGIASRFKGTVIVRVKAKLVKGAQVIVRVYGPDPDTGAAVTLVQAGQGVSVGGEFVCSFTGLAIGARMLCVYQGDFANDFPKEAEISEPSTRLERRRIDIPAGGLPEEFFDLSNP